MTRRLARLLAVRLPWDRTGTTRCFLDALERVHTRTNERTTTT